MNWAASALLILEGVMVTVAWMDEYGPRGLFASLVIALFSYGVETLGVRTGFPFGSYRYTDVLSPVLPGGVPLPVIFAWLTIIIAARSLTFRPPLLVGGRLSISMVISALLVTLLALDRKSTRLNSSHQIISYAVFCLKKKNKCIWRPACWSSCRRCRACPAAHRRPKSCRRCWPTR